MASLAARLSHLLRGRRGSAVVKSHKRFLASRSNPDHVSQRGCRSRALVSSAYDSATLRLFLVQLARTHKKDGQRSLRIGHKALARTDAFPRMSTLQLPHRAT